MGRQRPRSASASSPRPARRQRCSSRGRREPEGSRHGRSAAPPEAALPVPPAPIDPDGSENLAYVRLKRLWEERREEAEGLFSGPGGLLEAPEDLGDFEAFLERYLSFLRGQPPDVGLPPEPDGPHAAGPAAVPACQTAAQRAAAALPRVQDERFKHNFAAVATPRGGRSGARESLGGLDLALFRGALQHYEAFRQREALQGIRKLRTVAEGLPVAAERRRIVEAVQRHPVVLIAGETGCGKSTQVPQFLLEAGFRRIVVTQPRRIAAVSLARRVAYERLQGSGSAVGHQIRFDSSRSKHTRILFVTEGILLRQLEADAEASKFQVVVVDEVHERHLSVDLLLGVLREVLRDRRPDLKLVLMSATLQRRLFVDFFGLSQDAVVEVPGRCHPVRTEHIELPDEPHTIRNDIIRRPKKRTEFDCGPYIEILRRIEEKTGADERGDVLIFVPGAYEIEALVGAISEFAERSKRWIPLPLHSQLPMEQQDRVFDVAPQGVRKAIVATNIAETSVTIDGVRFVVDSGKMKGMDVEAISSVRHLAERWISKAAAEQRKGRAGRTGPGRCFRLYSERLFGEFEGFVVPEVHRTALEAPLLKILALGFELQDFRFPEPPRSEGVAAALQRLLLMRAALVLESEAAPVVLEAAGSFCTSGGEGSLPAGGWAAAFGTPGSGQLLRSLGLLEDSSPSLCLTLTPLGRVLSRLPVDVGVGKLLLLALVFGVQSHAVVLAGAEGLHSPRVQRHGERPGAGAWGFDHRLGDPFTTLRVYQAWLQERSRHQGGSDARSRRWARERGVDERALFDLNKANVQLCDLLRDGSGHADGRGAGLGARLRRDKMARLEAAVAGGSGAADAVAGGDGLSRDERAALREELEELKRQESSRQRRRLALEEGEGALAEDERGLGYSAEDRHLGGWDDDGDLANASGGEGNVNRELNRRKRPGRGGKDRVRLPRNDGLAERMRRRNIEFDLKYGRHGHTTKALEPLSERQESLLQLVVACALYPNLGFPHEKNREKSPAECVFHTRQVPFANLHPSSSLYSEIPTALAPWEGLAFGTILQTYMPFMMYATRCPVVPVALLSATAIDVSASCKMMICDQWLQLAFEDEDEVASLLEEAHVLRHSIRAALDHQIAELFEADCDDDVAEDLAEPEAQAALAAAPPWLRRILRAPPSVRLRGRELEDRTLELWRRRPTYQRQALSPNEYAAFAQASQAKGGDGAASSARPDAGSMASSSSTSARGWLRFGTVSEEGVRPESTLVSDHLAIAWQCPRCRHTFRFTRGDIAEHRAQCTGDETGGSASKETLPEVQPSSEGMVASVGKSVWQCDICGATLLDASPMDRLRHRRTHGL